MARAFSLHSSQNTKVASIAMVRLGTSPGHYDPVGYKILPRHQFSHKDRADSQSFVHSRYLILGIVSIDMYERQCSSDDYPHWSFYDVSTASSFFGTVAEVLLLVMTTLGVATTL